MLWVRILPLRRRLRQTTATCCFDRRRYACCRSSSALKPAGPVCWAPESRGADPGPALINHPELRCPRGRTPDILWHKRLISTHSLAYKPWIYLLLRSHYDHTSCSKNCLSSTSVCVPSRFRRVKGRDASLRCVRMFWSPADVTWGFPDKFKLTKVGQDGRHLKKKWTELRSEFPVCIKADMQKHIPGQGGNISICQPVSCQAQVG